MRRLPVLALAGLTVLAGCSEEPVAPASSVGEPAFSVAPRVGTTKSPPDGFSIAATVIVTDLNGGVTATDMATSLAGTGVTIQNVTYTGSNQASGIFTNGTTTVGFNDGIILSSGKAADVVGPNTSAGTTTILGVSGDAQLTTLAGFNTYDASILTFDIIPNASTVYFQYVFGSEEYPEYVGTSFNDVFAFWVNGVNCAVVGTPPQPVTINTINEGMNASLFRVNYSTPGPIDLEPDGLTTVLTCVAAVTPNVVNTVKLAIADAGDDVLDSWVFIKAGSFTTEPENPPPPPPPPTGDTEACSPGFWSQNGIRLGEWPVGYLPTAAVTTVFPTATGYLGSTSLLGALQGYKSAPRNRSTLDGAREILLRSAVAAVLNEAKFGAAYPAVSVSDLQAIVANALASTDRSAILELAYRLDAWNNNYALDTDGHIIFDSEGAPVLTGSCPLPRPAT
jgi:hypothetical protein